jgi:hypothetical protein
MRTGPLAHLAPEYIQLTGIVTPKPPWETSPTAIGLHVWGSEVPDRVIDMRRVVAVDGEKVTFKSSSQKVFKVAGSKGETYTVVKTSGGVWSCNCVGFGYRRTCRHIDGVRK